MATSTYSFIKIFSRESFKITQIKNLVKTAEGQNTINTFDRFKIGDSVFQDRNVLIWGNGAHTCRETLLSSIGLYSNSKWSNPSNMLQTMPYEYTVVFYGREMGGKLSEQKIAKAKTLFSIIDGIGFPFRLEIMKNPVFNNDDCLALIFYGKDERVLYLLSLLLYILRREEILDFILENMKDDRGLTSMLRLLSKEFLYHPEWGSSSNNILCLSIFCYGYFNGFGAILPDVSGPSSLINNSLSLSLAISYLKYLYIPLTKSDRKPDHLGNYSGVPCLNELLILLTKEDK